MENDDEQWTCIGVEDDDDDYAYDAGDEEGDDTFARGDKLDTDTLSFAPGPFRSTELDRLLRVNLSILKYFLVLLSIRTKFSSSLCWTTEGLSAFLLLQ